MLCGTFKKKRRHPGDEYRLVRSNTMPRILSTKEGSLVTVRRTKSSRVAARSSHLRDLLHMVSHKRARSRVAIRYSRWLRGDDVTRDISYRHKIDLAAPANYSPVEGRNMAARSVVLYSPVYPDISWSVTTAIEHVGRKGSEVVRQGTRSILRCSSPFIQPLLETTTRLSSEFLRSFYRERRFEHVKVATFSRDHRKWRNVVGTRLVPSAQVRFMLPR